VPGAVEALDEVLALACHEPIIVTLDFCCCVMDG